MSDSEPYDVVIVGAGVAGALVAKYLSHAELRVLVLEAGPATPQSFEGYTRHLERFYAALRKGPESPWPPASNAPQPDTADLRTNRGYFVQNGPNLYGSSYSRLQGGSTLHWLGVSLRMLPEDFSLRSSYGVGRDWPLDYGAIEPYYRKAERELGVAADVADQAYLGVTFREGYDYPMRRIPPSFSDQVLAKAVDGMEVSVRGERIVLKVRSYPAARNSIPRGDFVPSGAVDRRNDGQGLDPYLGHRCAGNTSCTPICPIQAKYNAGKTLARANHENLQVLAQAVVSKINVDPVSGAVQNIEYQRYQGPEVTVHRAKGRVYVLAAHAIENAKLMLASGLNGLRGLVGKNLMDHPALYAWGLSPVPVGAYRGPQSTSGIEDMRGGKFRGTHAAFRFDIGNDGWKATTGAPDTAVTDAVVRQNLFGSKLRDHLASTLSRQVRLSLAVEQLPDRANGVSVDPRYLDPLGNPRPVISYRIDDYTFAGMVAASKVYQEIFRRAGISDCTDSFEGAWFPSVSYEGKEFHYHGMGHFAGTHVMGDDSSQSVVNADQRSWDHPNLYLIGSGSFPTMGTSNPTLTLSALAIRTAERLVAELASWPGR